LGAVKVLLLAASLSAAQPALGDPLDRWSADIARASLRFDIPAEWIRRVMRIESGGQTMVDGHPIVSRAGAIGLMQLMPATWSEMRALLGLGNDPADPHDNILAGAAYLRAMYGRFGYPGLFGAYNAGPARYAAHLATGRALPQETRAYMARAAGPSPQRAPAQVDGLFAIFRKAPARSSASPLRPSAPSGLFVQLSAPSR
jgi:soluble lytic murein transglycosylase-like protein